MCSLTRGNQPAWSADRASLAEKPDKKGRRKLDGSQRGQVHPGLIEQHAAQAQRPSKKRQAKPIEISHKSRSLKELTADRFGFIYAKQTQFRVVEAATLEGWQCRQPARRQAWPTLERVALTGAEWDGQTWKLDNACPAGAAGRVASGRWPGTVASESERKDPLRSARASRPRCSANCGSAAEALTGGDWETVGRRGRAGQRPCPN